MTAELLHTVGSNGSLYLWDSMFELLIGFFLLGSLSLAFQEHREAKANDDHGSELDAHSNLPSDFDISVYEPLPVIEEEYLRKRYGKMKSEDVAAYCAAESTSVQ